MTITDHPAVRDDIDLEALFGGPFTEPATDGPQAPAKAHPAWQKSEMLTETSPWARALFPDA